MDRFEIEQVLESFRVIVDTREQASIRATERFAALGDGLERATLDYGDYAANITLMAGNPLYDVAAARIYPSCIIERKMSLDELATCFTRGRDRFRREMERAASNGSTVYLLVENATYEGIIKHRYRSRFSPSAFLASLTAWTVRYNLRPIFCKADTSGQLIKEILYRDMKERLERGEYG